MFDEHCNLNDGLGEGVSYRGRLLMSLRTEITDSLETMHGEVIVESINPISEVHFIFITFNFPIPMAVSSFYYTFIYYVCVLKGSFGRYEEYLLFGCIMEATMLDKKTAEKTTYLELSIGLLPTIYHLPNKCIFTIVIPVILSTTRCRSIPPGGIKIGLLVFLVVALSF